MAIGPGNSASLRPFAVVSTRLECLQVAGGGTRSGEAVPCLTYVCTVWKQGGQGMHNFNVSIARMFLVAIEIGSGH